METLVSDDNYINNPPEQYAPLTHSTPQHLAALSHVSLVQRQL
jgi:hypothetical protein